MANVKVKIEKLDGTFLDFDANYTKKINQKVQISSNTDNLEYSVMPKTGTIEFSDKNLLVMNQINQNSIDLKTAKIEIYIDNVLILSCNAINSEYNYNSKTFKITTSDKLSTWDLLQYRGYPITNNATSWYQILSHVLQSAGYTQENIDAMCSGAYDTTQTVKQYLSNIIAPTGYLAPSTLREAINKITSLSFLNVITDKNNQIKFVCNLPQNRGATPGLVGNNAIEIPISAQYSAPQIDICSKLKFDSISAEISSLSLTDPEIKRYPSSGEEVYSQSFDDPYYNPNHYATLTKTTTVLPTIYLVSQYIEIPVTVVAGIHDDCKSFSATIDYYIYHSDTSTTTESTETISGEIISSRPTSESALLPGNGAIKALLYPDETLNTRWYLYLTGNFFYNFRSGGTMYVSEVGRIKTFSFSFNGEGADIDYETVDFGGAYPYEYKENELLQKGTTVNGMDNLPNMLNYVINNNYSNGALSGKLTIGCQNYYKWNYPSQKMIDWDSKQVISVGSIVHISKNTNGDSIITYNSGKHYLWLVTSVTVRDDACPYIDIEFQEIDLMDYEDPNSIYYTITSSSLPTGIGIIYRDSYIPSLISTLHVKKGDAIKIFYNRNGYTLTQMNVYQDNVLIASTSDTICYVTVNGQITISVTDSGSTPTPPINV